MILVMIAAMNTSLSGKRYHSKEPVFASSGLTNAMKSPHA